MKQEEIFAAAEAGELTRVKACCEGVPNKLCSTDEWKGNLGTFVAEIERRSIQRCIDFIRGGSFLHDQAPPKLFANEVTAEMEKQLLPRMTIEQLHEVAKQMPALSVLSSIPLDRATGEQGEPVDLTKYMPPAPEERPDHPMDPILGEAKPAALTLHTTDAPGDFQYHAKIDVLQAKETAVGEDGIMKKDVVIPWAAAMMIFRMHVIQRLMRRGMLLPEITELMAKHANTYSVVIDEVFQELMSEASRLDVQLKGVQVKSADISKND